MKTYLRHRILNVIDVKELLALEYLDFEGRYKEYVESHGFWELCYIEKGQISLLLKEERITLLEKELILIPPDCSHSYSSGKGNENRAFVICFESPSHTLKPLGGIHFTADESQLYCMERMIEESRHTFRMNENDLLEVVDLPNFGGQQMIILQLEYLLISMLRRLSSEKNAGIVFLSGEKFYSDLTAVIINYFRENIHDQLSLDDICSKFNYSRSFLCKTFKKQTGESLIACFNRLKIDEAKKLLEETALSAADISGSLGFSDAKYFGVLFKQHTGLPPILYREQHTKNKQKN